MILAYRKVMFKLGLVFKLLLVFTPWTVRRRLLKIFFGYDLHPTSRIGLAWVFPRSLKMGCRAQIASTTIFRNVDEIIIGCDSSIGRLNYFTGYPLNGPAYAHEATRQSALFLGSHAAITSRHFFDCTNKISIGDFSTIGGLRSQFLTHSIDFDLCVQRSDRISIGCYSFVGTSVIVLSGSFLPDYSVLGAGSLLNSHLTQPSMLYAGSPARAVRQVRDACGYFVRSEGFVP